MHKINQLARLALSTAAMAMSLTAVGPSLAAETIQPILEVGQDFTIHGQAYKAGTYRVREVTAAGVMTLRHEQTGQSMMLMTFRTGSHNDQSGARMVFPYRNGQPELTEIWTGIGAGHVIR